MRGIGSEPVEKTQEVDGWVKADERRDTRRKVGWKTGGSGGCRPAKCIGGANDWLSLLIGGRVWTRGVGVADGQ